MWTEKYFWQQVEIKGPSDCWLWKRSRHYYGYGQMNWRGNRDLAHVRAFLLSGGKLRAGQIVRHTCDNPPCCNPAHLRAGTQKQNMRDKLERTGSRNGITTTLACRIRAEYKEALKTQRKYGLQIKLARKYGVPPPTMNNLLHRRTWATSIDELFGKE